MLAIDSKSSESDAVMLENNAITPANVIALIENDVICL